jgi:hypothetical protein
MMITKTAKLEDVQNKGQRAVIVAILAKLTAPIDLTKLTEKAVATGQYNGKQSKGHVNKWAQEKAGGDLGSVRYHVKALAKEGRVKLTDGVVQKPAKKQASTPAPAPQPQPEAQAAA